MHNTIIHLKHINIYMYLQWEMTKATMKEDKRSPEMFYWLFKMISSAVMMLFTLLPFLPANIKQFLRKGQQYILFIQFIYYFIILKG